jgi:hypothetical protein
MKTNRSNRLLAILLPWAMSVSALPACVSNDDEIKLSNIVDAGTNDADTKDSGNDVDAGPPPHTAQHEWVECQASDQAWVRRAIVALAGRKPWGQGEVKAFSDMISAIRQADLDASGEFGDLGGVFPPTGENLAPAREIAARIIMRDDSFRRRWADFFMDALRVVRIETKSFDGCYGSPNMSTADGGTLAAWVRDNDIAATNPPVPQFTMQQLLDSALDLDDVSPLFRAHLPAMMSRPYQAANVGPLELERARRQNFGAVFERAYLHRDRVCLACHNSEYSITFDADPAKNRHWQVPGLFEQALYGASSALHPPEEAALKGSDELRALSMLRYDGVAADNGKSPYGWDGDACGRFRLPTEDDPLGVDTFFGSIRSTPSEPNRGLRASVWDLERALHRGVDLLADHGLTRLSGDVLADPDEAFAYLVAQNIVDQVWAEIMGQRLTIANYFPRTQMQRDILRRLTDHFVASHFSLKTLLLDILAHPLFNLKAPDEGCGVSAYEVPRILNPWSSAEQDPTIRENSPGDGVFAMSSRPLRRSLHRAMDWPEYAEYPNGPEEEFQVATGFFLKDGEPGFRGLDFQGRLSWEAKYGACKPLGSNDFIAKLILLAKDTPGTTLGDVVIAVKDRLVGEPWIESTKEKPLVTSLLGTDLDDKQLTFLELRARSYCGVLVSSPQFMLGGIVPRDTNELPKLVLPGTSYDAMCSGLAFAVQQMATPYAMSCVGGKVTVTK